MGGYAEAEARFKDLMARARGGDADAARQLYEDFAPHVLRVVRRKLSRQLRRVFDSVDFTQEVWASAFKVLSQHDFANPGAFAEFLTRLAEGRVAEAARQYLQTQKYDLTRQQSLDDATVTKEEDLIAKQATPFESAQVKEQWELYLQSLSPRRRDVAELLAEGNRPPEVARALGVSVKTVRRILRLLAQKFRSLFGTE
jgi:RNA polymerase sigma factor (sigma-70 family)